MAHCAVGERVVAIVTMVYEVMDIVAEFAVVDDGDVVAVKNGDWGGGSAVAAFVVAVKVDEYGVQVVVVAVVVAMLVEFANVKVDAASDLRAIDVALAIGAAVAVDEVEDGAEV